MYTAKEATASTFVFRSVAGGWRLGLVWRPRPERWMLPGGHVEDAENPAEAALRVVVDGTGWRARLLAGPADGPPAEAPRPAAPEPWWVRELPMAPDDDVAAPHMHIDYVFAAAVEGDYPPGAGAHAVAWFTAAEVTEQADIAEDLRVWAKELFGRIEVAAAG